MTANPGRVHGGQPWGSDLSFVHVAEVVGLCQQAAVSASKHCYPPHSRQLGCEHMPSCHTLLTEGQRKSGAQQGQLGTIQEQNNNGTGRPLGITSQFSTLTPARMTAGVTLTWHHVPKHCRMARVVLLGPLTTDDVDAASFAASAHKGAWGPSMVSQHGV